MSIRNADFFWIEAGAMSGPPAHRHQIEFANDLAEFFDDWSRDSETAPLWIAGGDVIWRPLTYRGTDYGQWTEIWRLGLHTPAMGGPQYVDRIIGFRRVVGQHDGGWVMSYELLVEDEGSPQAQQWENDSAAHGQTGVTGGPEGRRFGWY
jgi:hypothetical protein